MIEPSIIHFSRPIVEDVKESDIIPLQLLRAGTVGTIEQVIGLTQQSGRGTVLVGSRDCEGERAAGTIVQSSSLDEMAELFYVEGDQPVPGAEETSASGNTVMLNHPGGLTTIRTFRADTLEPIGSRNINVRAGHVNYLELLPSPDP